MNNPNEAPQDARKDLDTLKEELKKELAQDLIPEVREDLAKELKEQLRPEIRRSLKQEMEQQVVEDLQTELQNQVREELKAELREQVKQELKAKLGSEILSEIRAQNLPAGVPMSADASATVSDTPAAVEEPAGSEEAPATPDVALAASPQAISMPDEVVPISEQGEEAPEVELSAQEQDPIDADTQEPPLPTEEEEVLEAEEEESDSGKKRKKRKKKKRPGWVSFLITLAIAIVIGLLLRFFVVSFISIDGVSMQPTLHTGNKVLLDKISYRFSTPQRDDIVVCTYPNSSDIYIKRVIGLPGETLEIKDNTVYINGTPVDEPYLDPEASPMQDYGPVVVEEGHVFVMGDNRNHSMDSTDDSVGQIPLENILGCARAIVWPLNEIQGL